MIQAERLTFALIVSVLSACGPAHVPPVDEPVAVAGPDGGAAPVETGGGVAPTGSPAGGTVIGTCPEGEELSIAEGQERADDEPFRMVAYLIGHALPCPPCPENAQCEACAPPFEIYADVPPGGTGTGSSAWVTLGWFTQELLGQALDSVAVGSRVLLCGAWSAVSEPGASRAFRVTGLEVLSDAP